MGYTKTNRLKKIIEIQNLTLQHRERGSTYKWIFENIIEPRFISISYQTYSKYLGINAKNELKKLEHATKTI